MGDFRPDGDATQASERMIEQHGEERRPLFIYATNPSGNVLSWDAVIQQLDAARELESSEPNTTVLSIPTLLDDLSVSQASANLRNWSSWAEFLDAIADPSDGCSGGDIGQTLLSEAGFVQNSLVSSDLDISSTCDHLEGRATAGSNAAPIARGTVWVIEFEKDSEKMGDKHARIRGMLDDINSTKDLVIQSTSLDLVTHDVDEEARRDAVRLIILCGMSVTIVLILAFRRFVDVLVPIFALSSSLALIYTVLSLIGSPFTVLEIAVAPLVVGLGIDAAIHMQRERRGEEKELAAEQAWTNTLETLSVPLSLAALTTMAAFLSALASNIPALRWFGIASAIGVAIAFTGSTILLASLHTLIEHVTSKDHRPREKSRKTNKSITAFATVLTKDRARSLGIIALITVGALAGSLSLDRKFDLGDFLDPDLAVMKARTDLRANVDSGSWRVAYLFVESTNDGGIDASTLLHELEILDDRVDSVPHVVGARGIGGSTAAYEGLWPLLTDAVERIDGFGNKYGLSLTGDGRLRTPQLSNNQLSSAVEEIGNTTTNPHPARGDWDDRVQKAVKFNPSGGISSVRLELILSTSDSTEDAEAVSGLNKLVEETKQVLGNDATVTPLGEIVEQTEILDRITASQLVSTLISLGVALLVLLLLTRRLWPAIMVVIPVGVCALWVAGSMALLGLDWNVLTVMVTALSIGLGIDYSIHIWRRFETVYRNMKDPKEAIIKTIETTGAALGLSAATTVAGFAVLLLSPMPLVGDFGMITGIAAVWAFVLAMTLLPILLVEDAARSSNGLGNQSKNEGKEA